MALIKLKKGICPDCPADSPPKPLIKKKCRYHYWKPKKEGHVIDKKSTTQKERDKVYFPLAKQFKAENRHCQILHEGCTRKTTDVHHSEGREGDMLFDVSKFVACCRPCHIWAEAHPTEAKDLGVSADRNK